MKKCLLSLKKSKLLFKKNPEKVQKYTISYFILSCKNVKKLLKSIQNVAKSKGDFL